MERPATSAEAPQPYRDPEPFSATAQGQALTFYPGGRDRFAALLRLIEGAERSLKLAFYIFEPDESGRRVRDAVTAAARRGVAVSLICDSFGSSADEAFFAGFTAAGGCYCCFSPKWNLRYLIRNHQKIVVADDKVAMLGGFNIEDDYFAPPEDDGWLDLAMTVEGSLVGQVSQWFDQLEAWARDPKARFRTIRRRVREWRAGEGPVQLLIGGPTKGLSSWAREVSRDLIEGDRLDMIMAYFSPAVRLRRRIARIARKGETRLIMPARSDNAATIGAARALYGKLLQAGARIWEFEACKLHTKLIVLDDTVYLGSANFDMRSLYLNLEIVVAIEDKALAERMREYVAGHLPASIEVTPELYREWATPWNRVRWWASWFLVSVVDYTVTRRLNLGL